MFEALDERSLQERRADATRQAILDAAWELSGQQGLTGWSMRALARAVGLKAPSLYAYFASKHAIYDAMFRQGYERLAEMTRDAGAGLAAGEHPRRYLIDRTRDFIEFCTEDPVRYQLMFQRVIPDFEPTPESYAVSIDQLESMGEQFRELGITEPEALDLFTAITTGLATQQISNDPGGDRWIRLVERACDLFCDHVGIPPEGATR